MTSSTAAPDRLALTPLLALSLAGFLAIVTENIPAGLLPQIGAGLDVSQAMAGQMVTVYALGSVVAAVPVIAATRSWNRRPLFMLAIAGLLVFNTLTALSAHYGLTLATRFLAGMAAGIVWGLIAGYARRLAAPHMQGRALAVVGVGQPIALALGVPLGTLLAGLSDWRAVFWIMSAVALLLLVWIRAAVPDFEGQPQDKRMPVGRVFTIPGVRPVLLVLFAWILAHNILYTYVAPFLETARTSLRVDVVLLVFGVSAIGGVWMTGLLVDRHLRPMTLASLLAFGGAALLLAVSASSPVLVLAGVIVWGLSFGGAPTLLQTALADSAGEHADVAQSLFVTVFNLAIATGGLAGGVIVNGLSPALLPLALLPLAIFGVVTVWRAGRNGFVERASAMRGT